MAEGKLSALTRLFVKIADSLSEEDVRNLRAILVREGLGRAKVEQATPLEMFNMLEDNNKIAKGDLQFLVQVLRGLGKAKLAEGAERLEQDQRSEGKKVQAAEEVDKTLVKPKVPFKASVSTITWEKDNLDSELTATEGKGEQMKKEITECSFKPGKEHNPSLEEEKLPGKEQKPPGEEQKPPEEQQKPPGEEQKPPGEEQKPPGGEQKHPGGEQRRITAAQVSVERDRKDQVIPKKKDMEKKQQQLYPQQARDRTFILCIYFSIYTLILAVCVSLPSGQSQASSGSLSESAVITIEVPKNSVESLPCSVNVTINNTDLIGGKVAPQIAVTSPQGKTTLIQTTAHTSPPLAAGKGQTSRVSRVWGAEWRPQESGKHTLGVCMGGMKNLASLTVEVGSNNPVLRLGQKGSQQGQFDRPVDVAVRGDRLYVADNFNYRVQVFDLSGKFCHSFSLDTGLVGLAVQTDGTIVVKSGKEVKKFSPSGKLLHKFSLGEYCTNPYALTVQTKGRIVVADPEKHSIFLFEADGTLVNQVEGKGKGDGQFDKPLFVCVDKEDNIIVADKVNHRVQVFDRNLNFKHKFGQWGRQPQGMLAPHGVSADSRGNIVLANGGDDSGVGGVEHGRKLQVFRPDGTWVSTISSDGDKLNNPHGVAVTEDGHVFVVDPFDHCIRKYRYM